MAGLLNSEIQSITNFGRYLIQDQTPNHTVIDVPIARNDDLPRSKSRIMRKIKWSLLLGSFTLEGLSLTFDQLRTPKKPIYAFMSMIMASLGLLISIIELSFRVRENNMIISRLLGDALENFGFFGSIWQCIYAVLQYIYLYKKKINNPIQISALSIIFLVCATISRLYNNYQGDSSTQRHIRGESSRDASRTTTLSIVEASVSLSNARAIKETEPVVQDDGVFIIDKTFGHDAIVRRRKKKGKNELHVDHEVGEGLSNKSQKQLQHWLEAIDPRHRYGHNLHLYYDVWVEDETTQPFFYWLDVGDGREVNLEKCPRSTLLRQCIKYLGPKEREAYEVVVKYGKLVYRQSGVLVDTIRGSKWIFVLSKTRALYVGQKKKGFFDHTSFLAGGATTASGRLVAHDGILEAIWPYSGHYLPTEENFLEFISFLEENNVDLSNVKSVSSAEIDDDSEPNSA